MANAQRVRRQQLVREAEGYLELLEACSERGGPPVYLREALGRRALEALSHLDSAALRRAQTLYLRGQILRMMEQFAEAVVPLEEAAQLDSENVQIRLSLAWCHKRTGRLDLAIQTLEEALGADPEEAVLYYHLACYWSLANNPKLSVAYLSRAFEIDAAFRDRVASEPDFDPIRKHPHFRALTSVVV